MLAVPWVRDLLARCRDADPIGEGTDLGGVCSTLRAGGVLLAVHFALRSGPRLHSWFPAYDVAARSLSPGNVLLTEVLKAAADRGVTAVDLGASDEGYKADYATETYPLCEGLAEAPGSVRVARRGRAAGPGRPQGAPGRRPGPRGRGVGPAAPGAPVAPLTRRRRRVSRPEPPPRPSPCWT